MARIGINTGSAANDNTGSTLRAAGGIINDNFSEIYTRFGDGTNLTSIGGTWTSTSVGIHTLKNVGIGTTNPTSALTVTGNGTFTGVVTATTFVGALTGTASTATLATNAQGLTGTPNITVGVVTASRLNVGTSGTVITTTASGLVGIGTTNPRFALEVGAVGASGTTLFVNGDARVTGIVTIGPASITLNGITNIINVGTGITINGSTGIISATSIVLGGTTLTGAAVTSITAGSGISVNQSIGNVTITATGGGGSSQWVTTAAGIHTLSNVGIGTTNPTSALTVTGNGTFTGVVTATTFVGALTGTATTATGLSGTPNITVGVVTATTFVGALTGTATTATNAQGLTGTPNITVGIITTSSLRGYSALVGTASSTTTTFVVTVASKTTNHRYYGTGSGSAYFIDGIESPFVTLLPGKTYRFNQENASNSSHPVRFYYDAVRTTQYTTNVTTTGTPGSAGAYTEIVVTDTTPVVLHYQCSNHGYMGNAAHFSSNVVDTPYQITTSSGLSVSGVSTLTSNVSVGGTISINGGVKLETNNATIVGTSGSTGEIKRIAGAPFFYDGSAWREFVLSSGTPVTVPADTEWNNVAFRATFDTNFTDAKFGANPVYVSAGSTIVGAAVTIGTGAFRNDGAVGSGISYAYRSEYDFTGSWTIEFWMYVDSSPDNNFPESLVSMHSVTGIGTSGNWALIMKDDQYDNKFISWYNQNHPSYINGTGLYNVSGATWDSIIVDKWNHFTLVRESNNGSLHFYVNGIEQSATSANTIIDNDILDINVAGLHFGGDTSFTVGVTTFNSNSSADVIFDDVRISAGVGTAGQRYTSIGISTYATFTPSAVALPTTGTLSSYVQPPGDKYGEIVLGGSPTWRGTSGVTVSQQSSGNYRVSFASTYTNNNDYFVLSHAMDQGFASYVGIARSTTHVDFSINKESDNAVVNTGSLAVQIKNHP